MPLPTSTLLGPYEILSLMTETFAISFDREIDVVEGRVLLERWRRNLATIEVELKQPRLIDVLPIQFVGGEPVQPEGKPTRRFRGQLIYFTSADVTVRRRSGAIVVIDSYEIVA